MDGSSNSTPIDEDATSGRGLAWLMFGIATLGCGLLIAFGLIFFRRDTQKLYDRVFPSPMATGTPTQTPTPTITPTPHVLIPPAHDETVFEETFDTNEKNWEPFYADSFASVRNGKLVFRSTDEEYIGITFCRSCPNFHDAFYFQAEMYTVENPAERYGLAICSPGEGPNYYVFLIDARDRYFSIDRHTTDWTDVTYEFSEAIQLHPSSNTLAVLYEHGTMNFYINNTHVFQYTDERPFTCRKTGFIVNGGLLDVWADNVFAYNIPPSTTPTP